MHRLWAIALVLAIAVGALRAEDAKSTALEQFKSLQSQYSSERTALIQSVRAAEPKEQPRLLIAKLAELNKDFAPKFLEFAKIHLGQDVAFPALMFVYQNGDKLAREAHDLLLDKYDAKLVATPRYLEGAGIKGEKLLRELRGKHPDGDAHVRLTASLANVVYTQAERSPLSVIKAARLKDAEKLFEEVIANAQEGSTTFEAAKGFLHEIRNLQIGKVMPDLTSEDLEGNTVKLSDFRGKVVVLDVWATWCGPCRAMIPHARELVERLKDKPFVLLSVCCDEKKDALSKFLDKEPMPWTHWWDGRGGPLSKGLNLRYYPTIYVLDAKGTIRFKGLIGNKMDDAVDKLLKEQEASEQANR
jgi:thiol-disulfide isomerase/thioredoxin